MAGISQNSMKSLRDIASMAYDTEGGTGAQGGDGRIGMIDGRVVKYNTHLSERLFGTKKSQEMIDGANALRNELVRIAADKFGADDEAVVRIKQLLGWNGEAEPKSLLDRKIVAQVVSRLLDNNEHWEGVFRAAHLDLKLEDSAANMDFAVQKMRVATGLKGLTYQGVRLIVNELGTPSEKFLAVLSRAAYIKIGDAAMLLSQKECEVLTTLVRNPALSGANASKECNREALLAMGRDLLFVKEVQKVNPGRWCAALDAKHISPEDRQSILKFLRQVEAAREKLDKNTEESGVNAAKKNYAEVVERALIAMLPCAIKRARAIQPRGEITFETWWSALRFDSFLECPSCKEDADRGENLLDAARLRVTRDFRVAGTGLLTKEDEFKIKEGKIPFVVQAVMEAGNIMIYEAYVRLLKHPDLGFDESELLKPVQTMEDAFDSENSEEPESMMRDSRVLGAKIKFGEKEIVCGPGKNDVIDEFLNGEGGLYSSFTKEQVYLMLHALNETECQIPPIYGGLQSESIIETSIQKCDNGDMRVVYTTPLVKSYDDNPENARRVILHEVIYKPDGGAEFVSLKCVDRNPVRNDNGYFEKIQNMFANLPVQREEDGSLNFAENRVALGSFDDNGDEMYKELFTACEDIWSIRRKVNEVGADGTTLHLDRFKLGLEDLRELKEFLERLTNKDRSQWNQDDLEELKKLHKIMNLRWQITQETSKIVGSNQGKVDELENELNNLLGLSEAEEAALREEEEGLGSDV